MKSIKEVKSDLNILKSQCSSRVKEHIYTKIRLITPDCDLSAIQESELVGMAGIMAFLKKHIPKTFEDVRKQYVASAREIMLNRIKSYRELSPCFSLFIVVSSRTSRSSEIPKIPSS